MIKRSLISLIASLLFVTVAFPAQARTEEPVTTADSVAVLDKKVSTLQKIVEKLPDISGFIQFLYTYEDSATPVNSQFRVRRARITLAGNIYKNYADYNLMVDFAGNVKLIDAYLRFTPWKQFNVQIGSFRPAFTLENVNYGATTMELIDYPQIVKKMTSIGDITGLGSGSAGRDIGIQAYGGFFNGRGFSTLQYYIGVFNGNGLDFNGLNGHKDIAVMLRINPTKDLAIIGSLYWGQWCWNGANTYADRNRWSAGFLFDNKRWFLRGEYIGGVTGGLSGDSSRDTNLRSDGAYLTGGVWFCDGKVAPILRAEYYTQNIEARRNNAPANTDIFYTAGVCYRPRKFLRVQADYTAMTYTCSNRRGNQVLVMLTGMF